jgi:cobalamin biosynthesis Mg chelatase CobN
VVALLDDLAAAGYAVSDIPKTSRHLLDALAGVADGAKLTVGHYKDLLARLPAAATARVCEAWGEAAGDLEVRDGAFRFRAKKFGEVWVALPPERGHRPSVAAAQNDAPTITILRCRRGMGWSPLVCGCNMWRRSMRSSIWVRTARWNGCRARR